MKARERKKKRVASLHRCRFRALPLEATFAPGTAYANGKPALRRRYSTSVDQLRHFEYPWAGSQFDYTVIDGYIAVPRMNFTWERWLQRLWRINAEFPLLSGKWETGYSIDWRHRFQESAWELLPRHPCLLKTSWSTLWHEITKVEKASCITMTICL